MFSLDSVLDDLWPQASPHHNKKSLKKGCSTKKNSSNLPPTTAT